MSERLPAAEKRRMLICITHSFPFGIGDDHMEEELKILATYFDDVLIIPRSAFTQQTRNPPDNATILRIPFKLLWNAKVQALLHLDWKELFSEISFTKQFFKKNPSLHMLRIMIGSLMIATDLAMKLQPIIDMYGESHEMIFYSYWNDLSAAALSLLKKGNDHIKVFSRAHAFEIYDERHEMNYIPLQRIKFNRLDHIFFISRFGFDYIRKRISMMNFSRCTIAKLGSVEMKSPVFRKDPAIIRIVSTGYNFAVKRIDLIARSLLQLKKIKVKWMHVGAPMHDKEYFAKLLRDIPGDRAHVEFQLTGNLSRDELKKLYAENTFDLLLNVSALEGIPVSMMECMSAGVPVMATSVGGVPEIVKHEYNGILLSGNPEPEEIAVALENFHSKQEEEMLQFRMSAKKTWQEEYNASVNYKLFSEQLTASFPSAPKRFPE